MGKRKRKFMVAIPISGSISIAVEATDEKAAIEAAWGAYNDDGADAGEVEWEAHEAITTGNVCHARPNSIQVTEHKE
jgi:hypothetical protein